MNEIEREYRTRERKDSDEPFKLGIVVCTFSEGFKLWHYSILEMCLDENWSEG